MKFNGNLRLTFMASVAALALVGCSDTEIASPGAPAPVPAPAPTPTPPPTPTPTPTTISLLPNASAQDGGCPAGTTAVRYDAVAADGFSSIGVCTLGSESGTTELTSNVTIPAGLTVAIRGPVFVGRDGTSSATLTLEAGARLYGASAAGTANATDDYIVVTRGSQLIVNGTEAAPVRMTARAAVNDEEVGSRIVQPGMTGQWGGLVINGSAPINACIDATATGGTAGCEKSGEGASGLFGGADADDDSGSINYLIVEYSGARLTNEDELNGIAFQGVGSGTEVSHIQVHATLDDGLEWFGGNVNVKYAVVTDAGDDSIDWTDGWSGALQFAAVSSTNPSSGDPRGIEADNRDGRNDAAPFSDPTVSNFTLIGSAGNQQGVMLRRGTRGRIVNGIVAGYPTGIDVDNSQTFTNFTDGSLVIASHLIDAVKPVETDSDGVPAFTPANNIRLTNNSLSNRYFPGVVERAVPAFTLPDDGFLSPVSYIGAFSPTETLASNWATFARPGTLFPADEAECPAGTNENGTLSGKLVCAIPGGRLSGNLTLSNGANIIYELDGTVFVGSDMGPDPAAPLPGGEVATLTIDPGVTVVAAGNDDYLVVSRGSRLLSNGTADAPVVFTAKGVVAGTTTVTSSLKGIWGGLVINGRAPINACIDATATGGTTGCEKSGEGASGLFGGASPDDDSGQLFYTRVEYAGTRLTNEDELNGIAFQGVGSGTEVSYVQVANNLDDGMEWFGGSVSADHVIITGVGDDSIDWTDGWTGSLQYAIVYPGVSGAEGGMSGDPRGIEADNRDGANTKTPYSDPKVSNFTLINSGEPLVQAGAVLRRGTKGVVANGIIVDFPVGLDVDSGATFDNFNDGSLRIKSLFLDNAANFATDSDGVPAFVAGDNIVEGNQSLTGVTFIPGTPGTIPGANEAAVPAFDVTGIGELEATDYIGAVEGPGDTWFTGWAVNINGAAIN